MSYERDIYIYIYTIRYIEIDESNSCSCCINYSKAHILYNKIILRKSLYLCVTKTTKIEFLQFDIIDNKMCHFQVSVLKTTCYVKSLKFFKIVLHI